MSTLRDAINACVDFLTAPACAFDSHSVACCEEPGGVGASGQQSFEWHNNFGTAADFQVPAEADQPFNSWDWSGSSAGGMGFD